VKYSRPGPTQQSLTKIRDRLGGAIGPNAATEPLRSGPATTLVGSGTLTAEQEATAAHNRAVRQAAQVRKVQSALAGARVANSLATAQNAVTAATPPKPPVVDALIVPAGEPINLKAMTDAAKEAAATDALLS
jgi:hypothetical protein